MSQITNISNLNSIITSVVGTANQIMAVTTGTMTVLSIPIMWVAPGSVQATTSVSSPIINSAFNTGTAPEYLELTTNAIFARGTDTNVGIYLLPKGTGFINYSTETGSGVVFSGITAGYTGSQYYTLQDAVQTTNATPTVLASVPIEFEQMVTVKATINGFNADYSQCIGGEILITAYRTSSSDVTLVGTAVVNANDSNPGGTQDFDGQVDVGTQTVQIIVTGVAAQTWNWVTTYSYMFLNSNT